VSFIGNDYYRKSTIISKKCNNKLSQNIILSFLGS